MDLHLRMPSAVVLSARVRVCACRRACATQLYVHMSAHVCLCAELCVCTRPCLRPFRVCVCKLCSMTRCSVPLHALLRCASRVPASARSDVLLRTTYTCYAIRVCAYACEHTCASAVVCGYVLRGCVCACLCMHTCISASPSGTTDVMLSARMRVCACTQM